LEYYTRAETQQHGQSSLVYTEEILFCIDLAFFQIFMLEKCCDLRILLNLGYFRIGVVSKRFYLFVCLFVLFCWVSFSFLKKNDKRFMMQLSPLASSYRQLKIKYP
jgi:hypothetical protein